MKFISWIVLSCFFASTAYGSSTPFSNIKGEGAILNGNKIGAKKMALVDAKVNALKTVFGVKLTSDRRIVGQGDIWMNITEEVVGRISSLEVVDEGESSDIYWVKISGWGRRDTLTDNQTNELKRTFTVGVCVHDTLNFLNSRNERVLEGWTANWLKESIQRQGFRVVDIDYKAALAGLDVNDFCDQLYRKKPKAIRQASNLGICNIIISGSNMAKNGYPEIQRKERNGREYFSGYVRAEPHLHTLVVDSGDNLLSLAPAARFAQRVAMNTLEDAQREGARQALHAAFLALEEKIVPLLIQYAKRETHIIDIVIYNLPDFLFNEFRTLVGQLGGWVKGIEKSEYDAPKKTATYSVQYLTLAATPDLLRLQLSGVSHIEVGSVKFGRVEATYKP